MSAHATQKSTAHLREGQSHVLASERASLTELVTGLASETRELVRLEVALARTEFELELQKVKRAAVAFAMALGAAIVVLGLLALTVVLAFGGTVVASLLVAAVVLCVGAAAALVGYAALPKHPLERTRERLEADVVQLKEQFA